MKHTHIHLPVELQFRGIPTTWTAGENSDNERVLFPAVNQNDKRRLSRIDDPEEIRKQFFRMEIDEKSALEFLNGVGVWYAIEDPRDWHETRNPRVRAMRIRGACGHRTLKGRAIISTVESLRHEQKYWREVIKNRAKLRAAFGPPPPADSSRGVIESFALMSDFANTLPIHLEWRGKHPHAVIQPITGRELLTALAWIDLITGAKCKICKKCGIEYTGGGPKFCGWRCEHANTVREWRRRKRNAVSV